MKTNTEREIKNEVRQSAHLIASDVDHSNSSRAQHFFLFVTNWPKTIILLGLILVVVAGSFIPTMQKDTRSDSFMPPDHPALVYRDQVKETFGLKDPMVIAVVNEGANGIFNPQTLALVNWLTEAIAKVDNIDPERITSLATENDIEGTEDGMLVTPFIDPLPLTQKDASCSNGFSIVFG